MRSIADGPLARRRALDVLRGIAILLVVTWHYLPQPGAPARNAALAAMQRVNTLSWSGVDLFFVLSGFLIVGILIDNRAAANYFRTFYARRCYRILPLYAVVLALAAFTIDWPSQGTSYLAHLVFQQNAVVAWTASWGLPLLEVTWSLAIEEQFYLLAPLAVRVVQPRRLPYLLLACIVVAPLSRLAVWALMPSEPAAFAAMTLLPCRIDALAIGALIAWAVRDSRWRQVCASPGWMGAAAVVFGVPGAVVPFAQGWAWPDVYVWTVGLTFIALFYGVLLIGFLTTAMERLAARWWLTPLSAAGIGAYSIYLFHLAIRDLASVGLGARTSVATWLAYGVVLIGANALVALVCWRLIERPAIGLGGRHRYRRVAAAEPVETRQAIAV